MAARASDDIREGAVRDYAAGESSTTVGKRYRIAPESVLKWVREAGHTVRTRGGKAPSEEPDTLAYIGGWERRGLVWTPLFPERRSA